MPITSNEKFWVKNFALEVNNRYFFRAELESINNLNDNLEKVYFAFEKDAVNLEKKELENFLKIELNERGNSYEVWADVDEEKFMEIKKAFGKIVAKYEVQDYIFNVIGTDGEIFEQRTREKIN